MSSPNRQTHTLTQIRPQWLSATLFLFYLIYFCLLREFSNCPTCSLCVCAYEVCMLTFASLIWAHSLLSLGQSLTSNGGIAVEGRLEMSVRVFDSLLFCPPPPPLYVQHPILLLHSFSTYSSHLLTHPPVAFPLCTSPYAKCLPPMAFWWYDLFYLAIFCHTEVLFSTSVSLSVITPHCIKVFSCFLVNGDCIFTALTPAAGQINDTLI